MNTRAEEGDTEPDRRQQYAANKDAWEGNTSIYRSRYEGYEYIQEGNRPFREYKRTIRNKAVSRTMSPYNDNNSTGENRS